MSKEYLDIAKQRIELRCKENFLGVHWARSVYVPNPNDTITKRPKELGKGNRHHPFDQSDSLFA